MLALFGREAAYLYDVWPKYSKAGDMVNFSAEAPAEALMAAAAHAGVWDVANKVRGPGGWLGEDGELVFHCGDAVWRGPAAVSEPGPLGRFVYPAAPPIPRPAEDAQPGGQGGPAFAVLDLLRTWNWKRGETDAVLLLGWIVAGMLGGALKWRPLAWITGGRGTGKSTLHDLVRDLLGDALVASANATGAGIWQSLGHRSLPVAIDELEATEDNRRAANVIELARQAASGGVILRGGQNHDSSSFTARSCFLFSSILMPPLLAQDVSRMAILELAPLAAAAPPALALDHRQLRHLGRALRRRIADGWGRFPELLETWRAQLAAAGHAGRGADQFGTLLACADLVLHDHPPDSEALDGWTARLTPVALRGQTDDADDHDRALAHLLSSPAEAWRGGSRDSVAACIRRALGEPAAAFGETPSMDARFDADKILGAIGLRVETMAAPDSSEARPWLCVANSHRGLAKLFEGTHWVGRSGASPTWVQTLRRVAGARQLGDFTDAKGRQRVTMRFGGAPCRATCLPLASVFGAEDERWGTGAGPPASAPAAGGEDEL